MGEPEFKSWTHINADTIKNIIVLTGNVTLALLLNMLLSMFNLGPILF